jgi:AcrR family transcriptional regulator
MFRLRAVLADDKQERQQALLDAAERLLRRSPERIANVAEVADEAGLAKGTVYLYFPSKEELLLALHERHIDGFFEGLMGLIEGGTAVTIDGMLALTHTHMVDEPTFLPLATRCFGMMHTEVPREVAAAFKERMFGRLSRAGAGLERHFPELPAGGGVGLLRHSFALIVGLWQMSSAHASDVTSDVGTCVLPAAQYPDELGRALRALWAGTLGTGAERDLARKD